MKSASNAYEQFTGHNADNVIDFHYPEHDTGWVLGQLDGVLYTTVRDGEKENYIHEFRERSRPLLAVSHDGNQILVVGGAYKVTERGIEDR